MTAQEIRQAMENKLEYLMEVKPQLATDDQLYKAAALVLRDIMVEKRRAHRQKTTEEKKKIYGDAKVDCVQELLAVMDSFERALEAPCTDENYKKGVEMTFAQIQKAFEKLGVTEVAAMGEAFDPKVHNAIKQVDDSKYDSDVVCEVFQKGYLLGDRLIRPAMVAVSI